MSGKYQPLTSLRILKKVQHLNAAKPGEQYVINRNPRNLEKLRIAYKPAGYHLERPGRSYFHKLELNASGRYVAAEIRHFQNGVVLRASTDEWPIKKHLFKTNDTAAYVNLARVLAARCLQSGIDEMQCNIPAVAGGKLDKFLRTLTDGGVRLQEPERIMAPAPWDAERPEKPWEITEDTVSLAIPKKV